MSRKKDYVRKKQEYLIGHYSYKLTYYKDFDYSMLHAVGSIRRPGKGHQDSFNDCIMMFDTETSKEKKNEICENYIVAWSLAIRAYDLNLVTLYGRKPSEAIECIERCMMEMQGDKTVIYVHNFSYDYVFMRCFMFAAWGTPTNQLNIKPHYPLFVEFGNGLIFKDSLILAQRKLEKWAEDLDVEHKKAVGSWDYLKIRNQDGILNGDELKYIENDVLAGVECIQKTMDALNKKIYSMPFTATGIPREAVRKIGKKNRAHDRFLRMVPSFELYQILEYCFHGGYTHNNRYMTEKIIDALEEGENIKAYDFASSYPFVMLSEKFPMEGFAYLPEQPQKPEFILENSDQYAMVFKLVLVKPRLKDPFYPMPALQKSKAVKSINIIEDNGRILCADYVEIYLADPDLEVILQQYDYDKSRSFCYEIYYAKKDYLPKWFADYIYKTFVEKTKLKGGDKVLYSIAKARLNSLYGMTVQKCVKPVIKEDYLTGNFEPDDSIDPSAAYEKYLENHNNVLPYFWGVYVTSYAFRNLFRLGSCIADDGTWLYSDTDSCYGIRWNEEKIASYNEECKKKLMQRGYGPVHHGGRDYWLGVAELDGIYSQFVSTGAKRYAVRCSDDDMWYDKDPKKDMRGKVKITVAGVPKKKGAKCLNDDLKNFHAGFIFDGKTTGKQLHTYFFNNEIKIDKNGNERADSIDLSPSDYLLDSVRWVNWEELFTEDIEVTTYDEDD